MRLSTAEVRRHWPRGRLLVVVLAALAFPQSPNVNPLLEAGFYSLLVAAVVLSAKAGVWAALQVSIVATLLGNVAALGRGEPLVASGTLFGVLALAALATRSLTQQTPGQPSPGAVLPPGLLASASQPTLLLDADGRCLDGSPALTRLLGERPGDPCTVGAQPSLVTSPRLSAAERELFRREGRWSGQLSLRTRDGTLLLVTASVTVLELPGRALYLLVLGELDTTTGDAAGAIPPASGVNRDGPRPA